MMKTTRATAPTEEDAESGTPRIRDQKKKQKRKSGAKRLRNTTAEDATVDAEDKPGKQSQSEKPSVQKKAEPRQKKKKPSADALKADVTQDYSDVREEGEREETCRTRRPRRSQMKRRSSRR